MVWPWMKTDEQKELAAWRSATVVGQPNVGPAPSVAAVMKHRGMWLLSDHFVRNISAWFSWRASRFVCCSPAYSLIGLASFRFRITITEPHLSNRPETSLTWFPFPHGKGSG